MAKKRRNGHKSRDQDKLVLNCDTIKFQVQEDRKEAVAKFSYTRHSSGESKELSIEMRVFSIWVDADRSDAIKAHLYAHPNNPQHRGLLADLRRCGKMNCGQFCFTADGNFIRYGKNAKEKYSTYAQDASHASLIYDSKAQALAGILEQINRTQVIGGLNLISLNRIPADVLKEIGYEEIPDAMKRKGVSMWKGSPVQAIGQDWGQEAANNRKQFLDLLGKTINV